MLDLVELEVSKPLTLKFASSFILHHRSLSLTIFFTVRRRSIILRRSTVQLIHPCRLVSQLCSPGCSFIFIHPYYHRYHRQLRTICRQLHSNRQLQMDLHCSVSRLHMAFIDRSSTGLCCPSIAITYSSHLQLSRCK